jgi:HAD superfamily hydrolase (TIGR01509 family)
MTVRAVVFDVDGTLVDSNEAHAEAWAAALRYFGYPQEVPSIRRLIGMGGDKLLLTLTGLSAAQEPGRLIIERRAMVFTKDFIGGVQPFPGTRELFERLKAHGLRLGIASSAPKDELASLLAIARISDLVDERASSDDVQASKPDPDIVAAAVAHLRVAPADGIMVGDTPYDLAAAERAGVRAIAFRCGGWADSDLLSAVAIYDGPQAMLAREDSWPF